MIATRCNMIEMRKRFPDGEPITMFCTECGSEWSGDDGDYWSYPLDYEFTCAECSEDDDVTALVTMQLGVAYTTIFTLDDKEN